MVFKYGQMVENMKVSGKTVRHVVKASSGMLMGISMKDSGRMIRQMDMAYICMLMVQST
jgi:hypothetical protein